MRTLGERHVQNLDAAQRYLNELKLPEGWWVRECRVHAAYPYTRLLPLVESVSLELLGPSTNGLMEVTVEVRPSEWDPEWLYATLLTLPGSVPVKRFEVTQPG